MAYVKDKLVFLHTHEGTFQVPMTLSKLMELLDPDDFLQVHRQYVVNIHAVDKVIPWFHGSYVIRVKDSPDSEIPVSRKHMQALRLALGIT